MDSEQCRQLVEGAAELGVVLAGEQIDCFVRYSLLLADWNQHLNLTRIPADQVVPLQFLDSLTVNRAVELASARSLIDVGSGSGFPGLALKIAFPHLETVLLDSSGKKLRFLDAVIEDLGMRGVRTLHARAEDSGRDPTLRESFDIATARAVAKMELLSEWLLPFLRVGGDAVALKSQAASAEIAAARPCIDRMGGRLRPPIGLRIPGTDVDRVLAVISKVRPTPHRYPRSPSELSEKTPPRRP